MAVLVLAAAGVTLAWAWGHAAEPVTVAGDHDVTVLGPGRASVFNGTVHAENATALSVLQAAGIEGGFEVRVRTYGAFGGRGCDGQYVESVAGHEAHSASGWEYRIWRAANGEWESPPQSAACEALAPGDRVEWRWTDASTA